jgi:hypothetical protein
VEYARKDRVPLQLRELVTEATSTEGIKDEHPSSRCFPENPANLKSGHALEVEGTVVVEKKEQRSKDCRIEKPGRPLCKLRQSTPDRKEQDTCRASKSECRFCGSNTVPPEYSYDARRTEVDFSLALSQMS